jgi:hypothetical protein
VRAADVDSWKGLAIGQGNGGALANHFLLSSRRDGLAGSLSLCELQKRKELTVGGDGVSVDMAGALVSPLMSAPRFEDPRGRPMMLLVACVPCAETAFLVWQLRLQLLRPRGRRGELATTAVRAVGGEREWWE